MQWRLETQWNVTSIATVHRTRGSSLAACSSAYFQAAYNGSSCQSNKHLFYQCDILINIYNFITQVLNQVGLLKIIEKVLSTIQGRPSPTPAFMTNARNS